MILLLEYCAPTSSSLYTLLSFDISLSFRLIILFFAFFFLLFLSFVLLFFFHPLHVLNFFIVLLFLLVSFILFIVRRYLLFVHIFAFLSATSLFSPLFYPPDSLARFNVRMLARTCFYTSEQEYFVYPALSQFFEFCGPPFRSFSLPLLSLRSHEPPGVSNGNRSTPQLFLSFSIIFNFCYHIFFFFLILDLCRLNP